MTENMFKIASIQVDSSDERIKSLGRHLDNMTFSITVKESNSRQIDSDIDKRIISLLSKSYQVYRNKKDLMVSVGAERIGELDGRIIDESGIEYYLEIEKSNKKTIWFDYVKILTCLASDDSGIGLLICPKNYAHKVGVWNLYKEAVIYKKHLQRVFPGSSLNRVGVIGYTQYVRNNSDWIEYDSKIVNELKRS
ncbi:MAG: hypothetical protein RPT95_06985 [Candidatus Sedimenticola sp. (ex Thyasira tokunagai)]